MRSPTEQVADYFEGLARIVRAGPTEELEVMVFRSVDTLGCEVRIARLTEDAAEALTPLGWRRFGENEVIPLAFSISRHAMYAVEALAATAP